MEVSKITKDDAVLCMQLLNMLKVGRWELSGPDIAAHANTLQWVRQLADKMAASAKGAPAPSDAPAMRVTASGPIGGSGLAKKTADGISKPKTRGKK